MNNTASKEPKSASERAAEKVAVRQHVRVSDMGVGTRAFKKVEKEQPVATAV